MEKNSSPVKKFTGTTWDFKGIFGNPELLFPLCSPKGNLWFEYLKVQKILLFLIIEGICSKFKAKIPCIKLLLPWFVSQEFWSEKEMGIIVLGINVNFLQGTTFLLGFLIYGAFSCLILEEYLICGIGLLQEYEVFSWFVFPRNLEFVGLIFTRNLRFFWGFFL